MESVVIAKTNLFIISVQFPTHRSWSTGTFANFYRTSEKNTFILCYETYSQKVKTCHSVYVISAYRKARQTSHVNCCLVRTVNVTHLLEIDTFPWAWMVKMHFKRQINFKVKLYTCICNHQLLNSRKIGKIYLLDLTKHFIYNWKTNFVMVICLYFLSNLENLEIRALNQLIPYHLVHVF